MLMAVMMHTHPAAFILSPRIWKENRGMSVLSPDFSEAGYLGEVEVPHLHRGHNHVESLFTGRAQGRRKRLHLVQQFDDSLVEAEVSKPVAQSPVFDPERAIACHAGHDF